MKNKWFKKSLTNPLYRLRLVMKTLQKYFFIDKIDLRIK